MEFAFDQTLWSTICSTQQMLQCFAALPTKLCPESIDVRTASQPRITIFICNKRGKRGSRGHRGSLWTQQAETLISKHEARSYLWDSFSLLNDYRSLFSSIAFKFLQIDPCSFSSSSKRKFTLQWTYSFLQVLLIIFWFFLVWFIPSFPSSNSFSSTNTTSCFRLRVSANLNLNFSSSNVGQSFATTSTFTSNNREDIVDVTYCH